MRVLGVTGPQTRSTARLLAVVVLSLGVAGVLAGAMQATPGTAAGCTSCGGVFDQNGEPLRGATVTLFAAPSAASPFSQVASGSEILAPATPVNPQVTGASGSFGWGVMDGVYRVVAQKAGCHAVADPSQLTAQSSLLVVPPGNRTLTLRLACDAPSGSGGGSTGGGGSSGGGGSGGGSSGGGGTGGTGGTTQPTRSLVSLGCSSFGPPLQARPDKGGIALSTSLQTPGATLAVSAADATGKPIAFLTGSRLGAETLPGGGLTLGGDVSATSGLSVVVRMAAEGLTTPTGTLTVAATAPQGAGTTLVIPFAKASGAPRVTVSRCGTSGLHAVVQGRTLVVTGSLALDEPATVTLAASYGKASAAFARGSRFGTRTASTAVTHLSTQAATGDTPFTLRFARFSSGKPTKVQLRIAAKDATGKSTVLALRFAG